MQGGTEESVNIIRSQEYINESLSMHRCVRECPVFHEYSKRLSKSLFKKLFKLSRSKKRRQMTPLYQDSCLALIVKQLQHST